MLPRFALFGQRNAGWLPFVRCAALSGALLGTALAHAQDDPGVGSVTVSCQTLGDAAQLNTAPGAPSPWLASITGWGKSYPYPNPLAELPLKGGPGGGRPMLPEAKGAATVIQPPFTGGSTAQWMRAPDLDGDTYGYAEPDGGQLSVYWVGIELPTAADAARFRLEMRYRAEDLVEGVWIGPASTDAVPEPVLINQLPVSFPINTSAAGTAAGVATFGHGWSVGMNHFLVVVRSYPRGHAYPPGGVSTINLGFAAEFSASCPPPTPVTVPVGPWQPLALAIALGTAWGWRRRQRR